MTVLLTVAIPHYDNISGLLATLDEVSKQHCSDMEVVVIDNATGLNFDNIKANCEALYPKVRFLKNKTNIGYDANVELCVSKSRGKFVWLLGSGDIPQENAIKYLLKIIDDYPRATNILLDVITDISVAEKKVNGFSATCQLLDSAKNKFCLTDLYRSALSGNVVDRSSWLEAAQERGAFENWCHVERSLQMHCNSKRHPFGVNAEHVKVFVARESQGWWNYNDLSFLQIVLKHREILFYFSDFESFKNLNLPSFCKPLSLTSIKAMLYSRSIPTPATAAQKAQVIKMIRVNKILFGVYKIIQLLPKTVLRTVIKFYKIYTKVYRSMRQ